MLDKLATFAVANGWTQNRRDASSLSISKGTVYQNLYDDGVSAIKLSGSTGYDSGSAWDAQPGKSDNIQQCTQLTGSFAAYHFFANNDYIHIVIEVDPGLFRHMALGLLKKSSAYTGGNYSCATNLNGSLSILTTLFSAGQSPATFWASSLYIDVDGNNTWKHFNSQVAAGGARLYSTDNYLDSLNSLYTDWPAWCTPNTFNNLTVFVPVQCFVARSGGGVAPLGYIEDLRYVDLTAIQPGAAVVIGANEWLIFPITQKGTGTGYSGTKGYAYKKIP